MSAKTRALSALEIAKGLVLSEDRRFWQITLDVAGVAANGGPLALFASDNPEGIASVVAGEASMALVNPSVMLTLAYRGTGPFREPLPVRAIAVMPSYDLFAFVVTPETGLASLEDVRTRHFPLRISLRGQRSHSIHTVLDCALAAAGFSVDELRSWGGSIHYEPGFDAPGKSGFDSPARLEMAKSGEINAIFDEAIVRWLDPALEMGMRALPLGKSTVRNLEAMGFRANVIEKAVYPLLERDVETIDFSGFAVFVREDAPDALVTSICAGLDLHRADIPWEGNGPLPIADMCRDTPDGPLDVPLHPAAERYWSALGYHPGEQSGLRGQIQPRQDKPERPPRIRSMLTLEVASEILARTDIAVPGAYATHIRLRQQTQDGDTWTAMIAAAERPDPEADVTVTGNGELVFRPDTAADIVAAIHAAASEKRKEPIS
jgi:TRAP-type uncharacterized transport system substrate-binding protein